MVTGAGGLVRWRGDFGENSSNDANNEADGAYFLTWQRRCHGLPPRRRRSSPSSATCCSIAKVRVHPASRTCQLRLAIGIRRALYGTLIPLALTETALSLPAESGGLSAP
jgi:hypothetical protein